MAMKPNNFLHIFAEGPLSFLAFLILSIFIFILVSDLSTNLLNNTKFWFCISNALIFIIAADCGAFSSPTTYFLGGGHRWSNNTAAQFPDQQNPQHNSRIILTQQIPLTTDDIPIKFKLKKSYERSKSEKVIRMAEKEKKSAMRIRSKTMIRHEASKIIEKEKKYEFAEMTNEELNRRVEEFIERFNRKIKFEEMVGYGDQKY